MDRISEITSKDNKYIKSVIKLQKSAKFRLSENKFVLEGLRICRDAYDNNIKFDILFLANDFFEKFNGDIKDFLDNSKKVFLIPDLLFQRISDTVSPQGIIAVAEIPKITENISNNKRYVALDGINDPSNLGAISRTAEALGISGIILTDDSCDPYSPKSLRASMGTLLRVPVYITDDLPKTLKNNKLRSFSCVVDGNATPINCCDFTDGDVIIIGNEANGISDYVKSNSDYLITIPMQGKAESLNAAAAAAIALFKLSE